MRREKSYKLFYAKRKADLSDSWNALHATLCLDQTDPVWTQTVNRLLFNTCSIGFNSGWYFGETKLCVSLKSFYLFNSSIISSLFNVLVSIPRSFKTCLIPFEVANPYVHHKTFISSLLIQTYMGYTLRRFCFSRIILSQILHF